MNVESFRPPRVLKSQVAGRTNRGPESRHDDFVLEAAGGDDQEQRTHGEKGGGVDPEMHPACTAKNNAAGDVDEISGGHEVAENIKELGHGFAGEYVAREKDTGKNRQESKLHGFGLGIGFAGN